MKTQFKTKTSIGSWWLIQIGGIIQSLGAFSFCIPSTTGLYVGLFLVVLGGGLYTPNIISNFGKLYLNKTKLLDAGPELVVCKKGQLGSHIFKTSVDFEIPAERVEVVDRTGAGDVYDAGFLAGLLLELPLDRCAALATKVAARSITGYGRDRYPDRAFLDAFLK